VKWRGQSTAAFDDADGFIIDQCEAIPQDVAARSLEKERPLTYGERRSSQDRREFCLARDELIFPTGPKLVQCRPLLAFQSDVLPLFGADQALVRRFLGERILSAAGHTKIRGHFLTLQ
jgi:hypothetical protein